MADRAPGPVAWPADYPGATARNAMANAAHRFETATLSAPETASNYALAAEWYVAMWCYGFALREESFDRARQLVARGLEVDAKLALGHTMQGVLRMGDWMWDEANHSLRHAIELDPQCAAAHHWLALFLSSRGHHADAISQSERAVNLEPSVGNRTGLGATLYFARDFERLAKNMQSVVDDSPEFAEGYDWLGMALVQLGRFDEAIATYERACALSGHLAEINAGRGHAYGQAGRHLEARRIASELERQSTCCHVPPVQMAFVHISLGDHDAAFANLALATNQRSWELAFADVEPWLDPLRGDTRLETPPG